MNYSLKTRAFSLLLALVMVIGMIPVTAFATGEENATEETIANEVVTLDEGDETAGETTGETVGETTGETVGETIGETVGETIGETVAETEGEVEDETVGETVEETAAATEAEEISIEAEEAAAAQAASGTSPYSLTVASTKKANLAPGVTETTVVAYDKNGDRIQYFVVNANMATDSTVEVKANYQNNDNTGNWGKATVVEQANAAKEKRGYNVVASINASYYNVSTGQPTGGFVMEGVNINGNGAGDSYPFFAVLKDGTAMIGKKGDFSKYADQIQEAVGGWQMLVWDGQVVTTNDASKYPRSTVGVKANGDVVLLLADGNNKPYSAGLTYAEQAQLMWELGCVAAVELDGGGSATYAAKLEGMDEIEVRNVCCDGTVRSVSNTLMVISSAVADGTFDHANLSTEYAFYAPNSQVVIDAVPVDAAGGDAEMPETVTWSLSDDSFGTVADGVFTSTGKLGTVTVNLNSDGKVVGSVDVTVVNPTSIAFSANEKTVPYGKTSDFTITAMYNGAEVYTAADAYNFVVSAGSMNGYIYTAPTDGAKTATVTATYKYAELASISVAVTFGKGSEILENFEDGDISEWVEYYGMVEAAERGDYTGGYTVLYEEEGATSGNLVEYGIHENVFLASRANGDPVYNGDYALGYTLDYTQSSAHANWQYAYLYYLGDTMTWRDTEKGINGTRLGMWMYIPEEAVGLCARLAYTYKDANGKLNTAYLYFTYQYVTKGFSKLTSEKIPEAGWAYVYCDLDDISKTYATSSYYKTEDGAYTRDPASNYAPAFIQFIVSSSATGAEKCTVYIDDITLDYSDVVDDRDAPTIKNPKALDDLNTYEMGSTLSFNTVSFTADVAEDTSHGNNFTGLNASTAQIYVDGHKVATTYSAGKIATANLNLPNGVHDVTFEIADKQGNYTKLTKQITIAGEATYPVVKLEGKAPAVNKDGNLYTGSQYDLLLKTDKVEAIKSVTTKIWLNSASKWSLANLSTLPGFSTTYSLDELAGIATVTVTCTGDVTATGEATLVTIPVYGWAWDGSAGWDSDYQWNKEGCAPQVTVSYKVKYGAVSYTEDYAVSAANYVAGFSNVRKDVTTELNSSIANLKKTIGIWHSHTETAVEDLANTCTTDGYTGRTVCSVCNSILTWGTTKATGHTYAITDGVLKCHCGETFSGTWTDGNIYVDGIQFSTGWLGDSYYVDGVKQTGIMEIDGLYYDLGEDGISQGLYTGLLTINGKLYYFMLGKYQIGWQFVDGYYYFFARKTFDAYNGYMNVDGHYYTFEDHKLVRGELKTDSKGVKYYWAGDLVADGWNEIDGNKYYFFNGYAYTGVKPVETSRYSGEFYYYLFGNDGIMIRMLDGIYEDVYYNKGVRTPYLGLVKLDGYFYYVDANASIIKGKSYYVLTTNDLTYDNGVAITKGTYTFDAEGKMVIKEGLIDGYYYENNKTVPYKGLIEHEGSFYYVDANGAIVKGKSFYVLNTNGLLYNNGVAVAKGTYTFDADGKMIVREGLVDGYYYENGKPVAYKGLIKFEGNFYYVDSYGAIVKDKTHYVLNTNGLCYDSGIAVKTGNYSFDADGKMVIKDGLVDGYYYEGNKVVPYKGLIEHEGALYYVDAHGAIVKDKTHYVLNTNGLTYASGVAVVKGNYSFDADGKMIVKDGLVNGYYYEGNKVVPYKGLIKHEGSFYYVDAHGAIVKDKTHYVLNTNGMTYSNGVAVTAGNYSFDADGKMIVKDGLVDGYYYEGNKAVPYKGLIEHEGNFYYVDAHGAIVKGMEFYVLNTNGLTYENGESIEKGKYTFDADGKMIIE